MRKGIQTLDLVLKPLIIAHSGVSRGTRCLKVFRRLLQLAYFVYASSESPGEVMHRYMQSCAD